MVAEEKVFVVAEVGIVAVSDPLLLDELELAGDAGVEGHEDDSAIGGVELGWVGSGVLGDVGAVGQTAARDAAAIDEAAFESEGVARVDAADVGSDRAASTGGVFAVGKVGAAVGVLGELKVRFVGGDFDGGSVPPATDEFGGEFFAGEIVAGPV